MRLDGISNFKNVIDFLEWYQDFPDDRQPTVGVVADVAEVLPQGVILIENVQAKFVHTTIIVNNLPQIFNELALPYLDKYLFWEKPMWLLLVLRPMASLGPWDRCLLLCGLIISNKRMTRAFKVGIANGSCSSHLVRCCRISFILIGSVQLSTSHHGE
jgi:hypothetical protein